MINKINKLFFKYGIYFPTVEIRTSGFLKDYQSFKKTQYQTDEWFHEYQVKQVNHLLQYARSNVQFYRKLYNGQSRLNVKSLRDLNILPCITKQDLKEAGHALASNERFCLLIRKTTGGSTGQPVTIFKSRDAMAKELAATWRGYSWAGIGIGDKQMRFWGVPFSTMDRKIASITDFICNRKRISAFSFDKHVLNKYTKNINNFNPKYFYGYLSMLVEYANFVEKHGGLSVRPSAIISTSEVMYEHQRKHLENVFGCKVYDEYGCGEVGSIAHECENGSMHVSAENIIVEILNGERMCNQGEVGEIVVTELNNIAMPLIRYRLGDFASLSKKKCKCGRNLPILEKIHGREYDIVTTKDGRKFHGEFFMYIFEEAKRNNAGIGKFKVIQNGLDQFTVKIVPEEYYDRSAELLIENRFKEGLGDIKLKVELVDKIDREKSGKYRVVEGMGIKTSEAI